LAIANDGALRADFFVWGLIPGWAKDPTIGSRLINARAETLGEKPAFRGAYKYRRCLIPADGFFEWREEPGLKVKTPLWIHLQSKKPFALAGLWEQWQSPDGGIVKSAAIITTEPNSLMAQIHNRMPVILPFGAYAQWLDPSPQSPESLQKLLAPFPAEAMSAHPVSRLVNSPANDTPACVEPAGNPFS
jgi:putative SOS response-associated peptidase YedK